MQLSLNKREKILLIITCALVLGSLLYLVLFSPLKIAFNDQYSQLNKNLLTLKKFKTILAAETEIEQTYNQNVKSIASAQTEKEETAFLMKEIDRIAKTSSIHLNSIKPLDTVEHEFYLQSKIDIRIETEPASLVRFITMLIQSDVTLQIEKLKISASGIDKNSVTCQIIVSKLLVK